jgi:hypothetical protein
MMHCADSITMKAVERRSNNRLTDKRVDFRRCTQSNEFRASSFLLIKKYKDDSPGLTAKNFWY